MEMAGLHDKAADSDKVVQICKILAAHGANFGLENKKSQTSVEIAIAKGKQFLVPLMIPSFKFDEVKIHNDQYLIHRAHENGKREVFETLLKNGSRKCYATLQCGFPRQLGSRQVAN
ncbi:MAG: ankyrin repeat protein [Mariniblastus sp.]|jgi:ankyrin repeat protein